ncbi:unnamed protein product [Adineta steineri]|uniref:Uncharacterized protein n=1 Tax=Adineta steineri TaxID=433720 RepID=A0A815MEF1_9BILA|nr:unnamed protein product [Adineta steineri]CAF4005483.1 unnamed protein product [Adineta steineri]
MKQGSENKSHIVHRIIISTRKSQPEHEKSRSKSPVRKFQYQIPSSFFRAVDKARLEAGYDILPRFHNPSSSSSSSHRTASLSSLALDRSKTHYFTKHNDFHSSSIVDADKASSKQVRFHHKFHKQSDSDHHHHHHHRHHHRRRHRKTSEQTASDSSLLQLTRSISSHRQSAIPRATSSTRSKHS